MAKPQQRCVFCDRTGLSKEHVWSEWTYELVPKMRPGSHARGLMTGIPGRGPNRLERFKNYQGSVNTIQIRVVCKRHCNNGWMSDLEGHAKPILSPLIKGERRHLSEAEQQVVARWIAVKVVVSENEKRDLAATTSEDRRAIMKGSVDPQRWQIWLGAHSSRQWHAGGYERHAVTLGVVNPATGIPEPHDNSLVKNTQAVTLGLGKLLIYAIYTRVEALGKLEFTGQLGDAMRQIVPFKGLIEWPPEVILNDIQITQVTSAFDRLAAKMPWRETP